MADDSDQSEKTEEPSQYKIEKFRNRGEVSSSKEVSSVLILSSVALTLLLSSAFMFEVFQEFIEWIFKHPTEKFFNLDGIQILSKKVLSTILLITAPVFTTSVVLGVLSQVAQFGFVFAPEALSLKLERINPVNGFQRLFSKKSIGEALKGVFKFLVILGISYLIVEENLKFFAGYLNSSLDGILSFSQELILQLFFSIMGGMAVISVGDFFWERFQYMQKLRMTKREVKDEMKEKEGNPELKQRIKTLQREAARKRSLSNVEKADVVVTNPTHYSVALRYRVEENQAPVVVAKGVDHMALKIRELARDHEVPMVENVLVARTLYNSVDEGESIPHDMYKIVAEILAYVYKKNRAKKALEVS